MNRPFKVLGPAVDLFNFMEEANDMIRDDYHRHPLVFAHGVLGFEGYPQEGLLPFPQMETTISSFMVLLSTLC